MNVISSDLTVTQINETKYRLSGVNLITNLLPVH